MNSVTCQNCVCLCRFSYLQKHTVEHIIDLREERWQPLIYYRASLLAVAEMEDAVSYVSSDKRACLHNRFPFSKQKLEGTSLHSSDAKACVLSPPPGACVCVSLGSKSPCQFRPADKVSKTPKLSTSPR